MSDIVRAYEFASGLRIDDFFSSGAYHFRFITVCGGGEKHFFFIIRWSSSFRGDVCVCVCPARASREGLDDWSWILT